MTDEYLFISDCHLDGSRPDISDHLADFLINRASTARFLYILGDLFEVWLGDDDPATGLTGIIASLKKLSKNTNIFFLAGNRDFLVGDRIADRAGFKILTEPVSLNLGSQRVILLHGDILCSDDHDYQAFRLQVRSPEWQSDFLKKPLSERLQIATGLRADSKAAMYDKPLEIMDVNRETVDSYFQQHGAEIIIHGHTHRPGVHRYTESATRYVLGDWNPQPSYVSWSESSGFILHDTRVTPGNPHIA
jgi:UDP-2,3-diacylglucosamine hydrolase